MKYQLRIELVNGQYIWFGWFPRYSCWMMLGQVWHFRIDQALHIYGLFVSAMRKV